MQSSTSRRWRRGDLACLLIVITWFLVGGVAHFAATDLEMRVVPPWVPWPRAAVLVSGVFELLGVAGLLYGPMRRAAAIGLFALTIAVTPVHVFMLQRPELFEIPYWLLVLRLPLQVVLLLVIGRVIVASSADVERLSDLQLMSAWTRAKHRVRRGIFQ